MSVGPVIAEIHAERVRQIAGEGFAYSHDDDEHANGEMAFAAAAYAIQGGGDRQIRTPPISPAHIHRVGQLVSLALCVWPWRNKWWKPTTPRRNLIKAGALIVAEIERLDRATQAQPSDKDPQP